MPHQNNESKAELWMNYIQYDPTFKAKACPESWYFCDNEKDADQCAQWVVEGVKQATSTSMWWFETYDKTLPKTGDVSIITNWSGKAKAIIQTTLVEIIPFQEVTKKHAEIEGEGDKSLEYWKTIHWDYFTREMRVKKERPTKDMMVFFEQFKTIWTENSMNNAENKGK